MSPATDNSKTLFFLLTCMLFIPILRFQGDLWDGVTIAYAFQSKNPEILHTWFSEAALYLSEWLYRGLFNLSTLTDLPPKTLITTVLLASVFFSALETQKIVRLLNTDMNFSYLATGLAILLPTLGLFFSSIFLMHGLMIYISLLGFRLYLEGQWLLGLFLCIISLEHNTNLVMFVSLLLVAYSSGHRLITNRQTLLRDAVSVFTLLIAIAILKLGFPSSGIYSTYNKPSLHNLKNLSLFWKSISVFAYFYLPMILLIVYCFLRNLSVRWLLCFVCVVTACILPYVLAGKHHEIISLYGGNGWNIRFLMNLTYVFIVAGTVWIGQNLKWNRFVSVVVACQFLWLGLHTVRYYAVQHKLLSFQEAASKKIKVDFSELGIDSKSGVVYQNRGIVFAPQNYVMQWILFNGLDSTSWLASTLGKGRLAGLTSEIRYRDKYIQSDFKENCWLELHWLPMAPVEKKLVPYFIGFLLADDRTGFAPKYRIENVRCDN